MPDNSEFIGEFITESHEHLQLAEESLLVLAMEPANRDAVQACFRALHTIKGCAGFMALDRIQALAHSAEQLLEQIRAGTVACGAEQTDALLQALTRLGELIDALATGTPPAGDEQAWIARLQAPASDPGDYIPADGEDGAKRADATSRRVARPSAPPPELVLEGLLSTLLALDRADVPGLITVLGALASHGREHRWNGPAMALVDRMQAGCDQLILESAGPETFAAILALAGQLQELLAAPTPAAVGPATGDAGTAPPGSSQSDDFCVEALDLLASAEAAAIADDASSSARIEDIFRAFHTTKGMAAYLGFARVEALAHRLESELLPVRDGEAEFTTATRSLVLGGVDALRTLVEQIRGHGGDHGPWPEAAAVLAARLGLAVDGVAVASGGVPENAPTIAEVLVDSGVAPEVVAAAAAALKPGEDLTTRLVKTGKLSKAQAAEVVAKHQELSGKGGPETFTRVSIARLEELVNLVGELLIAQAMVSQDADVAASSRLQASVNRQGRIVRDLQTLSLGLRMVPLKATFQKVARAVYDTARKLGKPVDFRVVGDDTEIDRTLVETLGDPLLHMVRNAVDHGIEPAAGRAASGKDAKGVITLTACQTSDHVEIRLSDDGRGLDAAKLRAKAVEKGLVPADQQLTEQECWQLIFMPGFSTAEQVTGISGRGVGMDVVKRNVEKMKGSIQIDSRLGQGSAFTIRLPITTAILDAMLLRVGAQRFLVPVTAIIEAVRPGPGQVHSVLGSGRVIESRNQILPVARLGERFAIGDAETDASAAVIMVLEHPGGRYALQVDEILGLQQVVIKPLDHGVQHHQGVAGTAILGDGRVGLILDPARLIA